MSRDPLDRYYTDDRLALACLQWLARRVAAPDVVLEPCSGGGAFGRAGAEVWAVGALGCDIDPDAAPGYPCERVSAADWRPKLEPGQSPIIVTNPHYVGVYETVRDMRALQSALRAPVLGLLLRATTIEQLMNQGDPPHMMAVSSQRPRWGGPGGAALGSGDTCGSVFCVWQRGPLTTATTIHGLGDWRPRGRA
jgi:hypothetical protein